MRILYVAYPLVAVSDSSCGGAEQMLCAIERGIAASGHQTFLAACEGSRSAGAVFATGAAEVAPDSFAARDAEHAERILDFLRGERQAGRGFDLVHDQSGTFWRRAAEIPEPLLLTAHLPRDFYGDALAHASRNVFVNCVSESQRRTFADVANVVGVVRNGIDLERFCPARAVSSASSGQVGYLLWLGRVCEEKGPHIAVEIGRRAGLPVVLAGDVYPFSYHQRYFERAILPHIDGASVTFIRRPDLATKLDLLRNAAAVLIPSAVDETSSLVAMEAAACGVPVVAFRRGALPEVIMHGETGFVVDTVEEMTAAIAHVDAISRQHCRRHAKEHFSAERMVRDYERLYRQVATLRTAQEKSASAA